MGEASPSSRLIPGRSIPHVAPLHGRPAEAIVAGVDSKSLTRAQVEKLAAVNDRHLRWLSALQRRMNAQHFPPDDELRRIVNRSRDVTLELRMALIYLTASGVGGYNSTPPPMTGKHGGGRRGRVNRRMK